MTNNHAAITGCVLVFILVGCGDSRSEPPAHEPDRRTGVPPWVQERFDALADRREAEVAKFHELHDAEEYSRQSTEAVDALAHRRRYVEPMLMRSNSPEGYGWMSLVGTKQEFPPKTVRRLPKIDFAGRQPVVLTPWSAVSFSPYGGVRVTGRHTFSAVYTIVDSPPSATAVAWNPWEEKGTAAGTEWSDAAEQGVVLPQAAQLVPILRTIDQHGVEAALDSEWRSGPDGQATHWMQLRRGEKMREVGLLKPPRQPSMCPKMKVWRGETLGAGVALCSDGEEIVAFDGQVFGQDTLMLPKLMLWFEDEDGGRGGAVFYGVHLPK